MKKNFSLLYFEIKGSYCFTHLKMPHMKVLFFNLPVAVLAISSGILWSCQKQVASPTNEPGAAEKSDHAMINSDKQERKILFVSNRDGNDEIYAMNADGSSIVRLTYNEVPDGRASWSVNGQHIAFTSGAIGSRDIYVMNANGQGLRNLTNTPNADEEFPEWSPTGNRIIFSSNRDGNFEIYSTDLGGDEVTRLTNRSPNDTWPTFSPDGSKIAFQSDLGTTAGRTDVFIMNADGSNVTRLTTSDLLD